MWNIVITVIAFVVFSLVVIGTTLISVKAQNRQSAVIYRLYKELKRFNDESDAMFNFDSDDIKNVAIRTGRCNDV